MVAPLKTRGLVELRSLIRRNGRLYALRRIGETDFKYIDQRLKEIEARIELMRERNVREEPF